MERLHRRPKLALLQTRSLTPLLRKLRTLGAERGCTWKSRPATFGIRGQFLAGAHVATRCLFRYFLQHGGIRFSGRRVFRRDDQLAGAREVNLVLPMPADLQLRQLCRSVQARPSERVNLRAWSERFGVSEKTLSRRFLRETGLTYRAWDMRMRLLSALPGLERGERVTDVALACGYDSLSAFISAFGKLFHATPGEFLNHATRGAERPTV